MISGNLPNALLEYTISLLDRAYEVADRYGELGLGSYCDVVGPHLRHVIEHYEALLPALRANNRAPQLPLVDYDARARDHRVERDCGVAQMRLRVLQTSLQNLRSSLAPLLDRVVNVRSLIGDAGQTELTTESTVARELTFLASHTVHHFALLEARAGAKGKSFGVNFGRAPATVAHDRMQEEHFELDPISA